MSRLIREGDHVICQWVNGDTMTGIIESMPAATGDLLYIKTDTGMDFGVNTGASSFETIQKVKS